MELIKTITHPDFPTPNIEIITREAARIVLIDENGFIPLIYTSQGDIFKIPGGGIDDGESIQQAIIREAKEETGCTIKILGKIGKVTDERPSYAQKKGKNLSQTSYCFYGKIIQKGAPKLTQSEIDRGFELVYVHGEDVLTKMKGCTPQNTREAFTLERDMYIFEKGYKLLKNYR